MAWLPAEYDEVGGKYNLSTAKGDAKDPSRNNKPPQVEETASPAEFGIDLSNFIHKHIPSITCKLVMFLFVGC